MAQRAQIAFLRCIVGISGVAEQISRKCVNIIEMGQCGVAKTPRLVGVITAAIVSLVAHFLVGAAKSLFTLRKWWSAGLEMTLAGVIVGGITYGIGLVLKFGA